MTSLLTPEWIYSLATRDTLLLSISLVIMLCARRCARG